jgi:hypothetical protein
MNHQRGATVVWIIVVLIIIIAGAAFWFSTRSSAQVSTPATIDSQTQQSAAQPAATPPSQPYAILPMSAPPIAYDNQPSNEASAATQYLPSASSQAVAVRNQKGEMKATPGASGLWQFTFTGAFAWQQQSYVLNFGDGTHVTLQCETPAANGQPVCDQLAPVSHTYTQPGPYQAELEDTSADAGAGTQQDSTLLSVTVPNSPDASAPTSDNTSSAVTPSEGAGGGSNSNSGASTNSGGSGGSSSYVKAGCTFVTSEGVCMTLIR